MYSFQHHNIIYDRDGEVDDWEVISEYDTLEACYAAAVQRQSHFAIVRWHATSRGGHGSTLWSGFGTHVPPIMYLRAALAGADDFERKFCNESNK